jgi:uncharacterized protein YraI
MFTGAPSRDSDSGRSEKTLRRKEAHSMHDIVIAIIFVAMVLAPCITAARSGAAEAEENL